ncbi:MAG: DNA primase [Sphaerochaeta sp.]|nr:DNA primase [Sphaerochaeta sp.]MCH3920684.1 DNA primase [Sphaerochaeta sp.]MCI2045101.1 DNA primase [Sphaerochaeta sp.]MCI2128408.1 DNA primase [Sphaerochaeta sp.]
MPKYSPAFLQSIKDKLLVSDVMGRYSKLVRRGNDYWCNCPIHGEKTPSLVIHDDKGTWHCFGCGKGGNIFTIVQEMEKCSFIQAVEMLAQQAGLQLEEMSPEERERSDMREALFELYDRISKTYHYFLTTDPGGEKARAYLRERDVKREMWEKFNLGYAPASWDLYGFLHKKSYSDELLKASGLFSRDRFPHGIFWDRLMFPVRTWQGRTVAFSGRDLTGESKSKYINTPETPIYSKKHNLFGIYESLDSLKKPDASAIICEGNFDVVAFHQAGLAPAMAPLGTAFTEEQAKLLKRYVRKVTLLFDSDKAGQNATIKALALAQAQELENNVAVLTSGKDASEVVQNHGEEALQNEVNDTERGFSYLVQNAVTHYDITSSDGKYAIFQEVKPYLDATTSSIVRNDLIKQLAEVLEVSQTAILEDFYKGRRTEVQRPVVRQEQQPIKPLDPYRLNIDLRTMLYVVNNRSLFKEVRSSLQFEDLEDREAKALYQLLEDATREGTLEQSDEYFLQKIQDAQLSSDVAASFSLDEYRRNAANVLNEAIIRITIRNLQKQLEDYRHLLELGGASDDQDEVIASYMMINDRINALQQKLLQPEGRGLNQDA